MDHVRIVRIPLPVEVIRQVDRLILDGVGGYGTRAEFILDAVQERLLELVHDDLAIVDDDSSERSAEDIRPVRFQAEASDLSMTELDPPRRGFALDAFATPVESKPLFGLHNRDYPSLWALVQLAKMTREQPVPVETYYASVLREAWSFGSLLTSLSPFGGKATALFPTNPGKRKSAEAAFRAFAIGDYRLADSGAGVTMHGPLYEWRVAAITTGEGGAFVAVTNPGWDLLEGIAGATVDQPHQKPAARNFLHHLQIHASADWQGFREVLRGVGVGGASRTELLGHFASVWPDWTDSEISTNTAGYVSRSREWGLVHPKQERGIYRLTEFGLNHLQEERGES